MEKKFLTIQGEHVHYFIQQQNFSKARILLEPLIDYFPEDPQNHQYKLVLASMNHDTESLMIVHKHSE